MSSYTLPSTRVSAAGHSSGLLYTHGGVVVVLEWAFLSSFVKKWGLGVSLDSYRKEFDATFADADAAQIQSQRGNAMSVSVSAEEIWTLALNAYVDIVNEGEDKEHSTIVIDPASRFEAESWAWQEHICKHLQGETCPSAMKILQTSRNSSHEEAK